MSMIIHANFASLLQNILVRAWSFIKEKAYIPLGQKG